MNEQLDRGNTTDWPAEHHHYVDPLLTTSLSFNKPNSVRNRSCNGNAVRTGQLRFASVKLFTSWHVLCPGSKISGGKVLGAASKRSANRAAQALKIAAASLRSSQSALGAYYRRMCARMDKPKAVTASAHKLARLIYLLITRGQE
jgi:hypothetical protein